jgi:hypothetical protein
MLATLMRLYYHAPLSEKNINLLVMKHRGLFSEYIPDGTRLFAFSCYKRRSCPFSMVFGFVGGW